MRWFAAVAILVMAMIGIQRVIDRPGDRAPTAPVTAVEAPMTYALQTSVVDALRRGDLHAAARLSGGRYVYHVYPHTDIVGPAETIEDLTYAEVILIGRTKSSTVKQWEGHVFSYFDVEVDQVLKGSVPQRIALEVEGGTLKFDDGTVVESRYEEARTVATGQTYALFLERTVRDSINAVGDRVLTVYRPRFGAQSIAGLSASDGLVKSFARQGTRLRSELDEMPVTKFLSELPARVRVLPAR